MNYKIKGAEYDGYDLTGAGEAIQINAEADTYTILEDGILSGRVQLGASVVAAQQLVGGENIQLDIYVTSLETGDRCLMPPCLMAVPAGIGFALLEFQPFFVEAGDIIEIIALSDNAGDNEVGGTSQLLLLGVEL